MKKGLIEQELPVSYNEAMKKAKKRPERKSNSVALELRRLGVVIEHVDDKVSLVAEQYGSIQKDIGGIRKTLDVHTEMIGKLAVDFESLQLKVLYL